MDWRRLLLSVAALLVGLVPVAPGPAFAGVDGCRPSDAIAGGCPTVTSTTTPTDVTLTATKTPPGVGSPDSGPRSTSPLDDCADPASTTCIRPFIATVTAPITLADIAAFRPSPTTDHAEPNGWTIAGLDTNFYATGGTHVVDGTLLGQPASVRFTPVSWHWSYGDGGAASHPYAGGTWAAQGIPEFDPTGTSHVYGEYGTYTIDLDVDFAAEYRYAGGSWVEIVGTLTVPANQLVITVGDARTVLVQRECTRHPGGPGC